MSQPHDFTFDGARDPAPINVQSEMRLRSYEPRDRDGVLRLYHHGLLTGTPDPLDPATDLDHIEEIYLKRPQDHFWVADANSEVVGSIAITEDDKLVAHVRRLRVDPAWKSWNGGEVARALIQHATHHAREHDSLKLVLHTPVDDEQAIALLRELGFNYARAREQCGRHVLEFYLNLYARPGRRIPGHFRPV